MDGQKAQERLAGGEPGKPRRTRLLGFGLLAFAVIMWVLAAAMFLLPLQTDQKLWAATVLAAVGEGAFWISALLLGREVVRRYRRFLDPRRWFRRKSG